LILKNEKEPLIILKEIEEKEQLPQTMLISSAN
jgi:hypothetical protein